MAALPKLQSGGNQYTEGRNYFRTSVHDRAVWASISDVLQRQADAVLAYGDQIIIDQVRAGRLAVSDAFEGIRAARDAKERAAKAEQERIKAEAAAQAEREALEKARAEREAAERAAAAKKVAAERAEHEAADKARGRVGSCGKGPDGA